MGRVSDLKRFLAKVDIPDGDGCWLWEGGQDRKGYGRFWLDGETRGAHRAGYILLVGPIPDGLQLDHLCREPSCVNPSHLEPVSPAENLRRAPDQISTVNAAKTHCKMGHEFTAENIYSARGRRECRSCRTEAVRRYQRSRQGD